MFPVLRQLRFSLSRLSARALSTATPRSPLDDVLATSSTLLTGDENAFADDEITLPQPSEESEETAAIGVPPPSFMNFPPVEDPLLRLFTSCIMQDGEREKASKTTSRILLHLHGYTRQPPLELFRQALYEAGPAVRCMRQRRGGKVLIKPIPLSEKQRMRQGIKWLWEVVNVRSKSATTGRTLAERTAREMIKILNGDSSVLRKKQEIHTLAMANRCVYEPLYNFICAELVCRGAVRGR